MDLKRNKSKPFDRLTKLLAVRKLNKQRRIHCRWSSVSLNPRIPVRMRFVYFSLFLLYTIRIFSSRFFVARCHSHASSPRQSIESFNGFACANYFNTYILWESGNDNAINLIDSFVKIQTIHINSEFLLICFAVWITLMTLITQICWN